MSPIVLFPPFRRLSNQRKSTAKEKKKHMREDEKSRSLSRRKQKYFSDKFLRSTEQRLMINDNRFHLLSLILKPMESLFNSVTVVFAETDGWERRFLKINILGRGRANVRCEFNFLSRKWNPEMFQTSPPEVFLSYSNRKRHRANVRAKFNFKVFFIIN